MNKIFKSQKQKIIVAFVGLFLITTGISYAVFSFAKGRSSTPISTDQLTGMRNQIEALPKTEPCPLNGEYYSTVERDIWQKRRPMGVMIENHADARPESGLSRSDVVYEAVAEGGITRFLALFYCGAARENVTVGPVRSARVYFIDWISEYGTNPLYVHFGGANNICTNKEDPDCLPNGTKKKGKVDPKVMALEKLISMGWRSSTGNALDGGANAGAPAIVRDQYRLGDTPAAWEHSAIGSTDLLFNLGVSRGFDGNGWDKGFVSWKFIDDKPLSTPKASKISFEFWKNKPDYDVEWDFDSKDNKYLRINGGKPFTDWEFDKPQLDAKNVVVMFVKEEDSVDQEHHDYIYTTGTGDAIVFQNGDVIKGTWEKPSQFERTKFYNQDGKEVSFVRGRIWIEAVPKGNDIVY